jgi:3-deoxy-D-manno-octulosonate 8-phosphate phosphatase (KDO 8-P phosphatase)
MARVRVVFFDVDGVFTDGNTWQDQSGQWCRSFSVRDTMGIRALRKAGLKVCVLTPVLSTEIRAHFERVGVDVFKDHCLDSRLAHEQILKALGLTLENAAFVTEGAKRAVVELRTKDASLYVASRSGGDGAVLEISNLILQHAGLPAGRRAGLPTESTDFRTKVGEL